MEKQASLRVVIVATMDWLAPPRLARSFRRAGFHVTSFSYRGLIIANADVDAAEYMDDGASDDEMFAALKKLLIERRPNLVVPGDEVAVELLQALAAQLARDPDGDSALRVLLDDSLGSPRHRATLRSRKALAQLASDAGVRTPVQAVVHDLEQARAFAERNGYPAVFKAEESCAGFGVAICENDGSLEAAFGRIRGRNPGAQKDGLLAQSFVAGKTAMRAVIAWRGQLLGGISALKIETHPRSTGPSSVVEIVEHAEMNDTASKLVRELGYSGFGSFDFQIDEAGAAHLIEFNARPTPICHLGHHFDTDLCLALKRAMTGEATEALAARGVPRKVALFPQEWVRRQDSPHFADSLHDVPWDEPALLGLLLQSGLKQISWGFFIRGDARRDRLRALLEKLEAGGQP
jgi:hypothetical protein